MVDGLKFLGHRWGGVLLMAYGFVLDESVTTSASPSNAASKTKNRRHDKAMRSNRSCQPRSPTATWRLGSFEHLLAH